MGGQTLTAGRRVVKPASAGERVVRPDSVCGRVVRPDSSGGRVVRPDSAGGRVVRPDSSGGRVVGPDSAALDGAVERLTPIRPPLLAAGFNRVSGRGWPPGAPHGNVIRLMAPPGGRHF